MVGRGEVKQARCTGSSQRLKKDWISLLPDPLISQILSLLPTKEAVRTSLLSTRWKPLWLWVSCLDLASCEFPDLNAFVSFGDRFFDSSRVSCISQLNIHVLDGTEDGVHVVPFLESWIDAAVKRKIQHLDVWCSPGHIIYQVPISIYTCEKLVSLKLFQMNMVDDAGFVSLPCVKTMHLKHVWFPNDSTFERLVSCCPALKELEIDVRGVKVFRVHSLSLKRLVFERRFTAFEVVSVLGVVIDAPLLGFLKMDDRYSESVVIKNLDSNAKLDVSLGFGDVFDEASVSSKRNKVREFLPGISKVGEMIISAETFMVFHLNSSLQSLPQFDLMSRLEATVCLSDLIWLPTFLERCPNLKFLVLALDNLIDEIGSEEMNIISFSTVPECLLSSLKFVDIKSSFSGNAAEMKLVRYLQENSIILEKITLRLSSCADDIVVITKLLEIPRRSINCQVLVL
ncbi:hypothetical protein EUTSA_v10015873mg [Eutrema salsugineum]|uniref:FBD domain-containing protein n=1 Tax=Eutrema salsugineum TaxID=72664 RepID=V4LHE1_EUTSA|nr:putative FBD-associated F-box protein At5g53635 [Eutrema salsugineum]ESQ43134.1 hypothetical protein EUTSA_v10015873mg [Eutrema salsugineum]